MPNTTKVFNVSYNAEISGNYLWITSWAGGLRRIDISSKDVWERMPLPLDSQSGFNTCDEEIYESTNDKLVIEDYYLNPRDPEGGGNHNHKPFSVLAYGDTVWVGDSQWNKPWNFR